MQFRVAISVPEKRMTLDAIVDAYDEDGAIEVATEMFLIRFGEYPEDMGEYIIKVQLENYN